MPKRTNKWTQGECRRLMEALGETEARQTALAEAEDYDAAEALTATVEALQQEHAAAAARLGGLGQESAEAAAALNTRRTEQRGRLEAVVGKLEALRRAAQQQAGGAEEGDEGGASGSSSSSSSSSGGGGGGGGDEDDGEDAREAAALEGEAERLEAERERLATERSSVARDRSNVESERAEYENQILRQTESEYAAKVALSERLDGVSGEIEELEAQLAEKRAAKA